MSLQWKTPMIPQYITYYHFCNIIKTEREPFWWILYSVWYAFSPKYSGKTKLLFIQLELASPYWLFTRQTVMFSINSNKKTKENIKSTDCRRWTSVIFAKWMTRKKIRLILITEMDAAFFLYEWEDNIELYANLHILIYLCADCLFVSHLIFVLAEVVLGAVDTRSVTSISLIFVFSECLHHILNPPQLLLNANMLLTGRLHLGVPRKDHPQIT